MYVVLRKEQIAPVNKAVLAKLQIIKAIQHLAGEIALKEVFTVTALAHAQGVGL